MYKPGRAALPLATPSSVLVHIHFLTFHMTIALKARTRMAMILGVSLFGPAAAAQQTGSIRGTVTTSEDKTPIAGARVALQAPDRVAITDERGMYVLRDVPQGSRKLLVTAIGRKPDSSRVSVVGDGATSDFALKEGSLMLSSVFVSATRTPLEAQKVAATVNVLSPEQVRQSPARESQDLLREFTSVELPRTSSLVGGTAQIVSIRGVDEGRTVVLTDGFPINDAWGEWIDWGRTPKAILDRVEVVEGGTSSLYGNGAMGGLISFFTRPLSPGSMVASVDGGSRSAKHGYVGAGIPIVRSLTANVFGDYQEKGGYQLVDSGGGPIDIESQTIQRNAFARLNYAPSEKWSAFLGGHVFGDTRNPGTPLSYASRDQKDLNFGLDYGTYSSGMFSLRAFDGRQTEKSRSAAARTIARLAEDSSGRALIPSHDWGASAVWSRSGLLGVESFSVGGDFRHYQGDYNEIQYNTAGCPTSATCGSVARFVSSGGAQSLSGAFVQALISPITPLHIDLSARVDRWDNTDGHAVSTTNGVATPTAYGDSSKTAFSPRVGLKYQLTSMLGFHAAYYRAFRAPNLAELYRKQVSPTQITVPNPYLSAENAEGREAGFDFQPIDWLQVKGTWYVADYNNFNVPTTVTGAARPAECGTVATCRTRLNVNKSRSEGGEIYVAIRPIRQLFLSAGATYDDARQQSGLPATATDSTKPHINRVPSPRQTIRGTWSSRQLGDWTAVWRHEGTTTTLQGVALKPFTVVDLNAQRELVRGLRGFVSLENVADAKYEINKSGAGTTASPWVISRGMPRTIRAGVEAYRF